jgi:2-polyprenyl-3-methyl-5-hydroxy-6-metoxy-1,4-benzoquinol methylase
MKSTPKAKAASVHESFDAKYYERYYENERTRVASSQDIARLGRFVCSYVDYLDIKVKRVLDAGCGVGLWQNVIASHYPHARYTGIEVSEHLCKTRGFTQASVVDYADRGRFDLVICQGVLQYLTDAEAKRAIKNLGRLCRGILYLEVLTKEDWASACDQRFSDGAVHRRSAAWYRKQLARDFQALGGGVFAHRDANLVLYALESLG